MESTATPQPGPAYLPLGSQVGPWRVVGYGAQGAFGTVHRVERDSYPLGGCFALKLATWPKDARFEREVELLWRLEHPLVPKLKDHGWWTSPRGVMFPYLVMDWVEGEPLYDWSARHRPTQRQAMKVLAQLARALEAVHAAGGLHRDVKGDNALVDASTLVAHLVDFGTCIFLGARALTSEALPPGTRAYRSPEALRFEFRWSPRSGAAPYAATPADDVYALGMTAFRLLTGSYPRGVEVVESEQGKSFELRAVPVLPAALAGVCPELVVLVRRMLSGEPSARGSAGELAEALERAARRAGPGADAPVPACADSEAPVRRKQPSRWRRALGGRSRRVAAAAGVLVALGAGWAVRSVADSLLGSRERDTGARDGDAVGLVEAAVVPAEAARPIPSRPGISRDMPKEPLPGQRRAPCQEGHEVEIRGGCWGHLRTEPPCGESSYEWKGGCYVPLYPPGRPPTSEQP